MTTIPDYITVLALSHETRETRELRAVRSTGLPLRERITSRFARRSGATAGAATQALVAPQLHDYPYRSGC